MREIELPPPASMAEYRHRVKLLRQERRRALWAKIVSWFRLNRGV